MASKAAAQAAIDAAKAEHAKVAAEQAAAEKAAAKAAKAQADSQALAKTKAKADEQLATANAAMAKQIVKETQAAGKAAGSPLDLTVSSKAPPASTAARPTARDGGFHGMTEAQLKAVHAYANGSTQINAQARGDHSYYAPSEHIAERIKQLDGAMKRSSLYGGVTHRGVDVTHAFNGALQKSKNYMNAHTIAERYDFKALIGKTITDGGFMSTSKSENVAGQFGGSNAVQFRITIPQGSRGLDLDRSGLSGSLNGKTATLPFQHEREVLLDRGSKFKVTAISTHANGRVLIHMDLIRH